MKKILIALLGVLVFASLYSMNIQIASPYHLQTNGGTLISTGPSQSVQVGTDILELGGSAIDAALASALYRITLDMGDIVSFAGIYMMVYYEASTGKVYSLFQNTVGGIGSPQYSRLEDPQCPRSHGSRIHGRRASSP